MVALDDIPFFLSVVRCARGQSFYLTMLSEDAASSSIAAERTTQTLSTFLVSKTKTHTTRSPMVNGSVAASFAMGNADATSRPALARNTAWRSAFVPAQRSRLLVRLPRGWRGR